MVVVRVDGPSLDTALTGDAFYEQFADALFYFKDADDQTERRVDLAQIFARLHCVGLMQSPGPSRHALELGVGISIHSKLVELARHVENQLDPDDDDLEVFVYERFLNTIDRAFDFHQNRSQWHDCDRMSKGLPPKPLRFEPQLVIDEFSSDWFWDVDSDDSDNGSDS